MLDELITFPVRFVIFKNDLNEISFFKILNYGFVRQDGGELFILDNKYEISFKSSGGSPVDVTQEEQSDINKFISNNKETIIGILNGNKNLIGELH